MWIVHWKIGDRSGHGGPVARWIASLACQAGNDKFGEGTHWMERGDE